MRELKTELFNLQLSLEKIDRVFKLGVWNAMIGNSIGVQSKGFLGDFFVNFIQMVVNLFLKLLLFIKNCEGAFCRFLVFLKMKSIFGVFKDGAI